MNKLLDRFDPFMFVVGILSIFVAVISLRNPLATFSAVVVIAAITAILSGIYKLTVLRGALENSGWVVFNAVVDIIIGILMLFNGEFGILFVAISFAIMFLMDSIISLWLSNIIKLVNEKYFMVDVILSVIGIVLGVLLLIYPVFSILSIYYLVGLFFMITGISAIIHSI